MGFALSLSCERKGSVAGDARCTRHPVGSVEAHGLCSECHELEARAAERLKNEATWWTLKRLLAGVLLTPLVCFMSCLVLVHPFGNGVMQDISRSHLRSLSRDLKHYRSRYGHYPETHEGFRALVEQGILEDVPTDPWGATYLYRLEGDTAIITTLGGDGAPGGRGVYEDLSLRVPPAQQSGR